MAATITEEQLRQFFERAKQAERLADALQKQINVIKQQTIPKQVGLIDAKTKKEIVRNLKELKGEVVGMEDKMTKLEDENQKLTTERDQLKYRIKHMREALKMYQP